MSRIEGETGNKNQFEVTNPITSEPRHNLVRRDFTRWPKTAGFPPISGGSGKEPEDNGNKLRPLKEVAEHVDLSLVRLQALVKDGKIKGELRSEGRSGLGKWYSSIKAVEEYKNNLWTPQQWGHKGGVMGGRGRPKSRHKKDLDT